MYYARNVREREHVCVREGGEEKECVWGREREREKEREREREREREMYSWFK